MSRKNLPLALLWTFAISINSVLAWQGSKVALSVLIFLCAGAAVIMLFLFELNQKTLDEWRKTIDLINR